VAKNRSFIANNKTETEPAIEQGDDFSTNL